MKCFIILAAFVAVASASRLHYGGAGGQLSTGTSSQFRSEDNYGNYNFGYDEAHSSGSTSRREEQTNGVRRGSYSLSDADGRHRVVNYIADASGFHATVETNEPGVEPKDPADVIINKGAALQAAPAYAAAPVHVAPAPVHVAPAPLPAPIFAAKGHSAPLAAPLPAPVAYGPAPVAYGPAPVIEAPAPRAFSYSFGATHVAPVHAAPVYAPAPVHVAPAPVYQQRVEY